MPLRPFPFPLSVGTDIISINRVRRILHEGNDNFKRYLRRFLPEQEHRPLLRKYGDADLSEPETMKGFSHFVAGRYAVHWALSARNPLICSEVLMRSQMGSKRSHDQGCNVAQNNLP